MKQEDKDLLLKDLCARLPYSVKILVQSWDEREMEYTDRVDTLYSVNGDDYINTTNEDYDFCVEDIKPYLFPISSMTEEQKIECFKGTDIELDEYNEIWSTFPISNSDIVLTNLDDWLKVINWLNKNHFDYRGLIKKSLALDATNLDIY